MLYDDASGHDALFEGLSVDAATKFISLSFLAYPSFEANERIAIEIEFGDVDAVLLQADMIAMQENRFAGTVNQWKIAEGAGTSYFQLIEGYLTITSRAAPRLIYK